VSGTVAEVNKKLDDQPELVNQSPYGEGWMIVIEMTDPSQVSQLLTAQQYEALLQG
jgi:glycine cleavage system H protein